MPLTLGYVLARRGADHRPPIRLEEMLLIRHVFRPGIPDELQGPEDLTEEYVLEYTSRQGRSARLFPADPPRYWVAFIADGGCRARLWGTFENRGELLDKRTDANRFFDLRPSGFLAPLKCRLVVDWDVPRSWHRRASADSAKHMPVLEI